MTIDTKAATGIINITGHVGNAEGDSTTGVISLTPPEAVKQSDFGCRNCLLRCVECNDGDQYIPKIVTLRNHKQYPSCENYTYYD